LSSGTEEKILNGNIFFLLGTVRKYTTSLGLENRIKQR